MEKLKFGLQVFTAVAAFPVLTMMELNHSTKNLITQQQVIKQQTIKTAEGYYFNTGSNTAGYQKKHFVRRYCK